MAGEITYWLSIEARDMQAAGFWADMLQRGSHIGPTLR